MCEFKSEDYNRLLVALLERCSGEQSKVLGEFVVKEAVRQGKDSFMAESFRPVAHLLASKNISSASQILQLQCPPDTRTHLSSLLLTPS
jgi:hypothetical protein